MKKFIGILFVGMLLLVTAAVTGAPPIDDQPATVEVVQDGTNVATVVISVDSLREDGVLYASTSVAPQDTPKPVAVEEDSGGVFSNFSLENILSLIMLVVTTVFGAFWKKVKTKFKGAVELLDEVVTALEDDKLTGTEIASIKQRYYKLVGKS